MLIRGGVSGTDYSGIENVRWFPETARTIDTYPSVSSTCEAFAAAGFPEHTLEQVRETRPASLAEYLDGIDTMRQADTTLRALTDDEFERGKERIRRAVEAQADDARSNSLPLLILA